MKFSLFIDFDGTITTQDVGARFFTTFSDDSGISLGGKWTKHEISSVEALNAEAAFVTVSKDEFIEFLKQFTIDPGSSGLYDLCASYDIPIYIISNGLDIYIDEIMKNHGFGHIPVFANEGAFKNGGLEVEFPCLDKSCSRCANCKGISIRKLLRNGDKSIFVGDGYSDLCAVDVADYLFAKGNLADYLTESGKNSLRFEKLQDVTDRTREDILRIS